MNEEWENINTAII